MSQTVTPSSRRSYTISAQIGSDNLQKGANGQVGMIVCSNPRTEHGDALHHLF
jgi:hypothetical protein